ncbi:competence protein CoiA family protein [Pedobacter gandavensis]|uniref:competence protein CoiA family protein n=1 Tax=Pedobacter gandavensis TaxID=2679963 RepID=UPI0024799364|nr:competence protein CoiA family protein [Pedobacter gandavensis]WGQ08948.1 competence protein CoiA family protein [Pedobacter gandavensis]
MTGQPIVGINKYTKEITPISKVAETGLKCNCMCHFCESPLEAVLNTNRKKHFRHSNKINCNPTPESELHLLAKRVILNNVSLYIPAIGMTDYTNPVCEVKFNDLVPDATITVDGLPFYVEIVVTNPIDILKFSKYKADRSRVLVINLDEEDRDLDYESLEALVTVENSNRYILSYPDISINKNLSAEYDSWWKWLIGAGMTAFLIWNNFFKGRRQKPSYRRKKR